MDIRAEVVPYSSVVGSGVMLADATGRCIAILGLMNVHGDDHKKASIEIAEYVAKKINEGRSP